MFRAFIPNPVDVWSVSNAMIYVWPASVAVQTGLLSSPACPKVHTSKANI